MRRKVIAMLLAGVMAAGLLTGCGGKTQESASEGTAAGTTAALAESEAAENGSEPQAAENGECVTVKWCVFGDKAQDHDLVMEDLNKKLKEKINVQLELEVIPQGEFADKMKLASTAGEDFDMVFTSNWLNKFDENMGRDAFMPIDDLLNEYGQDILASIPDWLLDVATVDGKIYAVPNQQIIARQLGVAIQREYAEKYGFDKTSLSDIRELEPFLDEIVKNEPEMFPIDVRVNAVAEKEYESLANGFVWVDKKDQDSVAVPETTAMEAQLRLDNEWYKKGYIRKDIATVTDNTADVKANRYVCTLSSYKPGWDAEFTSRQGVEYITVPIDGIYLNATSGIETMTAFNVNSSHPEEAMKLLNLVYSDKEIFNEILYGLEGVHYNKNGENSVEIIGGSGADSKYNYSSYAWKIGNQFNAWYMPGQEDGLWEETDKLNREAQVSALRGFVFNPADVQSQLAQLDAVSKEFKNGQFTTDDIDKYLSDRAAKMEQAGLTTVVEEVQRQIDEWKEAQ